MNQAEMLGLGLDLRQAVANGVEQVAAFVQLALKAQRLLADKKVAVRVVSMPSTTTFDREDAKYKASVLPAGVPRIAVEMGVSDGWWKYGVSAVVGIDTFGESAPAGALLSLSASSFFLPLVS
jgi:transketolase